MADWTSQRQDAADSYPMFASSQAGAVLATFSIRISERYEVRLNFEIDTRFLLTEKDLVINEMIHAGMVSLPLVGVRDGWKLIHNLDSSSSNSSIAHTARLLMDWPACKSSFRFHRTSSCATKLCVRCQNGPAVQTALNDLLLGRAQYESSFKICIAPEQLRCT